MRSLRTAMSALVVFLLAGLLGRAAMADTTVRAYVDRSNISLGQQITLKIEIVSDESPVGKPRFLDMSAFTVYSSGTTRNIQWINGVKSSSLTYDYVLAPRDEGEYMIGPATVKVGGKEYRTNPIRIKVAPGRSRAQTPSRTQSPAAPPARKNNHRVFITARLDRDTAYVNQPLIYTFGFYRGERLLSNPDYTRPSFNGFWVEDLPEQRKYSKVIDGVRYEVVEIRYALFPTDAGTKRIEGARLKARVATGKKKTRRGPFSLFDNDIFGRFDRGEDLSIQSDPIELTVLPLPEEGKPRNFSGLVGHFSLRLDADMTTVAVGDPITVTLTVEGKGNIKSIPAPTFDTIPDLRTFAGGSSETISTAGFEISGKKVFEQVFVPQRPGAYHLPVFSLSYFDPDAKRYRTLKTESLKLTATGAAADFTIPSLRLDRDELSDLAADVRFIKTEVKDFRWHTNPGLMGWSFWVGHAIPLLGLGVFFGWRRRTLRIAADPVGRRRRLAYKNALARLASGAGSRIGDGLSVEEIAETLMQYFTDRFNRPAQGARRDEMRDDLLRDGVSEADAADYLTLLDECDRGRYAGGVGAQPVAEVAERARNVLARLEGKR